MIEGFKLKVTSYELKIHCEARSAYHASRAVQKEEKLPELKKSLETLGNVSPQSLSNMSKGGYNFSQHEPIKDLEQDITEHKNKSLVFAFFASHLFDEDYTLREDDLQRLEILKR